MPSIGMKTPHSGWEIYLLEENADQGWVKTDSGHFICNSLFLGRLMGI